MSQQRDMQLDIILFAVKYIATLLISVHGLHTLLLLVHLDLYAWLRTYCKRDPNCEVADI